MPGIGELIVFLLIPVALLAVAYRIGHRIGKAEGRLLGRDEARQIEQGKPRDGG